MESNNFAYFDHQRQLLCTNCLRFSHLAKRSYY